MKNLLTISLFFCFLWHSVQEASGPLLPIAHDGLLPGWLLPRRPRRWRQSCRCGYVPLFLPVLLPFTPFNQVESFIYLPFRTTGVLTREFLDFSASRGNNLRSIGLEPGCKWCLCTTRWKEAADARKSDDDPVVPK